MGSLFSFLQFISMPIIGMLSDIYGRRPLYLICLTGISISYFFWSISINHFGIFVLFRILNGLSKGNVSLSTAIVTDVTTENKRGKGFATIGIAFSIGFIVCSINSTDFNSFKIINLIFQSTGWPYDWCYIIQITLVTTRWHRFILFSIIPTNICIYFIFD